MIGHNPALVLEKIVSATSNDISKGLYSPLEKTSKSTAKQSTPRPKKEDFASFEEYDLAYLSFQKENMERLIGKYPNAISGGKLWTAVDMLPDDAFEKGLPADGGDDFDLVNHQRELTSGGKRLSGLRGSCVSAEVPAKYAGESGYVYLVEPEDGGISVSAALRPKRVDYIKGTLEGDIMPGEQEIAIGRRQPKERIIGARKVQEYHWGYDMYRLGPMIPNPNYKPLDEKKKDSKNK